MTTPAFFSSPLLYTITLFRRIVKFVTTTILTNTLGLIVGKLRSHPIAEKAAKSLRQRFPWLWRSVMRIIKPLYLTYQWRNNSKIAHEFSKSADTFDNEKWVKQQAIRSRNYHSYPTCSGIANTQPNVDPKMLLSKINKNLDALTR
jgi:hypothetical protein